MKYIITIVILAFTFNVSAEIFSIDTVIQAEGKTKEEIFINVKDWFASSYNSAKDVIQMEDKEAGTIIGRGNFNYSHSGMSYTCYTGIIEYLIKVYMKDGRFKIIITNFNHEVNPGNSSKCQLGMITSEEIYTDKGMIKKYHNEVWTDIKSNGSIYALALFESVKNYVNSNSGSDDDDW